MRLIAMFFLLTGISLVGWVGYSYSTGHKQLVIGPVSQPVLADQPDGSAPVSPGMGLGLMAAAQSLFGGSGADSDTMPQTAQAAAPQRRVTATGAKSIAVVPSLDAPPPSPKTTSGKSGTGITKSVLGLARRAAGTGQK